MSELQAPPLILDFDRSVPPLSEDEIRLDLHDFQESIRFACSSGTLKKFAARLEGLMPTEHGCVFLGSGDYHHLTLPLLKRLIKKSPGRRIDLLLCDNHPDNMRYLFGIHCGSWVYHAARLEAVRHIHVLGISSGDIGLAHCWENHLWPLLKKKLTYWSVGRKPSWLELPGLAGCHKNFKNPDQLMEKFLPQAAKLRNIYLSIDKDVLRPEAVRTNWDQGTFEAGHLEALIKDRAGNILAADITGDVSIYRYKNKLKRWISLLDAQKAPDPALLEQWREQQRKMNKMLLECLRRA